MAVNKRNIVIFSLLLLVALVLLLDPFAAIGRISGVPRARLDDQALPAFAREVSTRSQPALDAVIKLAGQKKVVFIGEHTFIADEMDFAQQVFRRLPDAGVEAVGLELFLSDDQARIDALMAAPEFDEKEARTLILRHIPVFGFKEYVDMTKALWETAQLARQKGSKFRVLGLSYSQDFSLIEKPEDSSDPAILKRILTKGSPDQFMADLIAETLDGGTGKMVVFAHRRYGLKSAQEQSYNRELVKMGFVDAQPTATALISRYGKEAVGTVFLHSPWPDPESQFNHQSWPVNGQIDQAMQFLGSDKAPAYPFALETSDDVFGSIVLKNCDYRLPNSMEAKLYDVCDIYVVLAPIARLRPAAAIPDFINSENLSLATAHLPKLVSSSTLSPEGINSSIQRNADALRQDLVNFQ